MTKTITADHFILQQFEKQMINEDIYASKQGIKEALIEFTKLHVQAALNIASCNAVTKFDYHGGRVFTIVDRDSILNSYPLNNIQ